MKQIASLDRDQIQMISLEMMVDQGSMVRLIDLFLDFALNNNLGFEKEKKHTGRPAFPIRTLLGVYIYGYLNRIRSSRKLEKECKINVELMWLVKGHKPCYKTIANFRKDNRSAFENLFKLYRKFCLSLDLYGKETIAIDGSKFRAQNSMKNNYNLKKIERHLDYIETKEQEYLDKLDQADNQEAKDDHDAHERLAHLAARKINYESLKQQLENSEETQISTVDPDARALPLHMRIVQVGYNVQSAVDDKHNLIVDYQVTNKNDHRALSNMAIRSKQALGINKKETLNILADKGYHTADELALCHKENIKTIVAIKRKPKRTDKTKAEHLHKDKFEYNHKTDSYTCPKGRTLNKQARYQRKNTSAFDRYTIKNSICKTCSNYEQCVSKGNRKSSQGRYIDRYLNDTAVEQNKVNVENNKDLYKKRQSIVEHPFGTIKRNWGYGYTLMKTKPKVQTEFSIIMLCYNIRRSMSIMGIEALKIALKAAIFKIYTMRSLIAAHINHFLFYKGHTLWRLR